MKQSLVEVARTNKFDELEALWAEQMLSDISRVDIFLIVADLLRARSHSAKAANLLAQLSDELYAQKQWKYLKNVLFYCSEKFSKMRSIREHSLECIQELNKNNSLLDVYLEKSGLSTGRDLFSAWSEFDTYSYLAPGAFVLHNTQFGAGIVTIADPITDKLEVDFAKKKRHAMGLQFAAKVLTSLPDTHYYSRMIQDEAQVRGLMDSDPSELVKIVVKSFGDEISVTKLKDELCGSTRVNALIDLSANAKAWTNWWTKAKKAVDKNKFLTLTAGVKGTISVREHEMSYADEALANVIKLENILDKISVVRTFLKENSPEEAAPILEQLAKYYDTLSSDSERIELLAVLLEGGFTSEETQETLNKILESFGSLAVRDVEMMKLIEQPFYKTLAALKNNDSKRIVLKYINVHYPEHRNSIYQAIAHIDDIFLWGQTVSFLQDADPATLVSAVNSIFSHPDKFPGAFYRVIRDIFHERLSGEGLPSEVAAIRKAIFVLEINSVNPHTRAMQVNIPKLLADPDDRCHKILQDYLNSASKSEIEPIFRSLMARDENGESKIRAMLLRTASKRFPELIKRHEVPYWENEKVNYITQKSRQKIEEEINDIVNVQLPANAKEIGYASSLGDLSENAEFDAAKAARERLNGRAQYLKGVLENAVLIENINRQEGRIEVGVKATIKNTKTGEVNAYSILGAQEADLEKKILNYKAPFALAMLGKKVGDVFSFAIEGNSAQEYVIESLEPVSFDS